jgi:hypothetical protein
MNNYIAEKRVPKNLGSYKKEKIEEIRKCEFRNCKAIFSQRGQGKKKYCPDHTGLTYYEYQIGEVFENI